MRGCYIGNNRVLVSLTWGGKLIVHANDMSISPDLIIHGIYDVPLTNFLLKNLKPHHVFVDVGANMGLFTVLAGYLVGAKGKVIAFEANINHYELIKDNIALNYLTGNTLVFHAAVYSTETRLTFHATERFMGNGSIVPHDDFYKNRYNVDTFQSYEVDAVALDDVLIELPYINFVKLDIEGGEYHAFMGMQRLLEKKAIGTVIFELNKRMLGKDWFSLYSRLAEYRDLHGYSFFLLNLEGDLKPIELDALFTLDEVPAVVMTA
ncbi:Methyltransferase FkbM family [Thermobacillus xylanilyticus]|uniref:Methyltransferase FkbM family n=1 Tax=Thermobacillus xylanilyticus TaxID=76633 RepID=A0ABN7S0T1_THEXY|nr:FkbM family methyltransferase [Thermobacillus xylanilyticus]CAG5088548.1 Methyltransferase FkbM family [Thermobacillus xylanilyticus]